MTKKEIFMAILKDEGLTQEKFCERVGIGRQSTIASKLARNISIDSILKLLEPLGYEVVIRKASKKKSVEYKFEVPTDED